MLKYGDNGAGRAQSMVFCPNFLSYLQRKNTTQDERVD